MDDRLEQPNIANNHGRTQSSGVSTYIHPLSDDAILTIGLGPADEETGLGLDWSNTRLSCLTCLISLTHKKHRHFHYPQSKTQQMVGLGLGQKLLGAQGIPVLGSKRYACSAAKHLSLRLLL